MNNIPQTDDIDENLTKIKELLSPFLKNNPTAKLINDEGCFLIIDPWNDDTLGIEVSLNDSSLIESLNNLLLPPPLSAIFHTDTSTFEFIFTVTSGDNPLWCRNFEFLYLGCNCRCFYGESSDRLLQIARGTQFMRSKSLTEHRNLQLFRDYCNQSQLPSYLVQYFEGKKPISFYIGPVVVENTDQVLELARHINFYMFFFDRKTPQIVIHSPKDTVDLSEHYFSSPFPEKILGTQIDTYMLDLWSGAQNASGRLAFLYYYQILEYAAFYYIDEQVRHKIGKNSSSTRHTIIKRFLFSPSY